MPEAQRRRLYNAWLDRQAEEHRRKQARKGPQAEEAPGDEQQPRQDFDSDSEGRPGASQVSSSHRSQKSRGSAWLAKKKERAQKHGGAYGGLTRDEARLQGAELATGIRGSAAMSAHSRAITITRTMTPSALWDHFFNAAAENVKGEADRWIRDRGGEAYCYLCKKVATAGHRSSQQHVSRVREDLAGNFLAGPASSVRRFDEGLSGYASQTSMCRYWGEYLLDMPAQVSKMFFQEKQKIAFKKDFITPDMIAGFNLAVVSYTGQGRYDLSNKYYDWADLLLVEPDDKSGPDYEQFLPPEGHTWWPVTEVVLLEHAREALIAHKPTTTTRNGRPAFIDAKLIVCFYQWQDGIPQAWTILTVVDELVK